MSEDKPLKLVNFPEHEFLKILLKDKKRNKRIESFICVAYDMAIDKDGSSKAVVTEAKVNYELMGKFRFRPKNSLVASSKVDYPSIKKLAKMGYITIKLVTTAEEIEEHKLKVDKGRLKHNGVVFFQITELGKEVTEIQEAYKEL
jgi:hypothetical protein